MQCSGAKEMTKGPAWTAQAAEDRAIAMDVLGAGSGSPISGCTGGQRQVLDGWIESCDQTADEARERCARPGRE
jgi:hypothetical protein